MHKIDQSLFNTCVTYCFILLVVTFVLAGGVYAQTGEILIDEAATAILAGRPGDAIDPLDDLFERDPAAFSAEHHSAAYWLGKAYLLEGYPDDAREVWNIGLRALDEAGLFDPLLAVAFIRAVSAEEWQDDATYAAGRYLRLLGHLGALSGEARRLFLPYQEALPFVIPTALQEKLGMNRGTIAWSAEMGNELISWWRSQDPAPATRNNELLEEHLERVAYAEAHFRSGEGFDDRAEIYVRLGPPSRQTEVRFDGTRFRNKVIDQSLTLNVFDFPDNEFWFYDQIGDPAQYIFHNSSGTYRIGETRHLLPSSLRTGYGSTDRGREKSRLALRTLEEIYRQLSLFHQSYSNRYLDVASFVSLLDDQEDVAESNAAFASPGRAFDVESDVSVRGSVFSVTRPDLFLQNTMSEAKAGDEMIAVDRDEYVPVYRTEAFDDVDDLSVHVRLARFLASDGTTRTEMYWAAPSGALAPGKAGLNRIADEGYEAADYLMVVTSVQKDLAYRERVVNHHRLTLPDVFLGEDASVPTQVIVAEGDTGTYHISMQWDQHVALLGERSDMINVGPKIKSQVFRADSLFALRSDPGILEMSDLRPLRLPAGTASSDALPVLERGEAIVSPSPEIDPAQPLVFYFEIYHLTYGADDRTRYTVAYEIQRTAGSGLRLRRNAAERTAFETTYEHTERSAQEHLLLDLSDWQGKGELEITVRITDQVSGQTALRKIGYEIR